MYHSVQGARRDVTELAELAKFVHSRPEILPPPPFHDGTDVGKFSLLDDYTLPPRLGAGPGRKGTLCQVCQGLDIELDIDRDGIPDFFEDRFPFLNPRDPSDAVLDQDGDGFTNLEEFRAKTGLEAMLSHPPLISLVRYLKTFRRPIPVLLKHVSTNESDDSARWDLNCQFSGKGRPRSRLCQVGETIGGYKILSANSKRGRRINPRTRREEEGEMSEIVVRKGADGVEYTLVADVQAYERDYYAKLVYACDRYDPRKAKPFTLKAGQTLTLSHSATRTHETYTVESVGEKSVTVTRTEAGVETEVFEVKRFDRRRERDRRELWLPRPAVPQDVAPSVDAGNRPGSLTEAEGAGRSE